MSVIGVDFEEHYELVLLAQSIMIEQMKRVQSASSKGSVIKLKSHVAPAWRFRVASS